jgi:hypothetical protein
VEVLGQDMAELEEDVAFLDPRLCSVQM